VFQEGGKRLTLLPVKIFIYGLHEINPAMDFNSGFRKQQHSSMDSWTESSAGMYL
jgi:hypothetical protein